MGNKSKQIINHKGVTGCNKWCPEKRDDPRVTESDHVYTECPKPYTRYIPKLLVNAESDNMITKIVQYWKDYTLAPWLPGETSAEKRGYDRHDVMWMELLFHLHNRPVRRCLNHLHGNELCHKGEHVEIRLAALVIGKNLWQRVPAVPVSDGKWNTRV